MEESQQLCETLENTYNIANIHFDILQFYINANQGDLNKAAENVFEAMSAVGQLQNNY